MTEATFWLIMASAVRIAPSDPVIVTFLKIRNAQKQRFNCSIELPQEAKTTKFSCQLVYYLLDVPDMKSPLSDILILAPLAWEHKSHLVVSWYYIERNNSSINLERSNLTDFEYVPSTTTNYHTNMLISNANCQRVTSIFLHVGKHLGCQKDATADNTQTTLPNFIRP